MKQAFKYVWENVPGAKSSLITVIVGIILSFVVPIFTKRISQSAGFFIILALTLVIAEELRKFTSILGVVYTEMKKAEEEEKK